MAGRRTRTNKLMPGNMPPGRLNPTIGFGGEGRRSPASYLFLAGVYGRAGLFIYVKLG